MNRNYPQFFAITRAFGLDKDELAQDVSKGRTSSLKALTANEWNQLMEVLQTLQDKKNWAPPPGDVQRKKMISIARQMGWHMKDGMDGGVSYIVNRLDKWAQAQKYKKPLMKHTVQELNILLSIFEEKVFTSYLKNLNK